jgi:hypothetical protein
MTPEQESYINKLCYSTGSGALRPLIVKVLELEAKVEGLMTIVANLQAAIASDRQRETANG